MSDRPSLQQNFIGGILMALVAASILFGGGPSLESSDVRQRLDRFAAHISETAKQQGRSGSFSYGAIEIKGWGSEKYALVRNVSVEISEAAVFDTNKWLLSTEQMIVTPGDAGKLHFSFPGPLNVIHNSQLAATVSFPSPLEYSLWESRAQEGPVVRHIVTLPPKLVFDPPRMGDGSSNADRVVVTYDGQPEFFMEAKPDAGRREVRYELKNLHIHGDKGPNADIGSLTGLYLENDVDEKVEGRYEWKATDLIPGGDAKGKGPYTFQARIGYRGEKPQFSPGNWLPMGAGDMSVETLSIIAGDFELAATGNISVAADDPLPFGRLDLRIENPELFIESGLISEPVKPTAVAALKTLSAGQRGQKQLIIPLKREKNGVLYVGNLTFEQLTAAVLKDVAKSAPKAQEPSKP